MSSILKVNTIQDTDGNNIINENANVITIGASGDTITVPAGATVSGFTSAGIDDNATSTAITISSDEDVTFTEDILLGDDKKAIFGAGSDLQIYHDSISGHSFLKESGSGSLVVQTNNLVVQNAAGTANIINAPEGTAGLDLYYNGNTKLSTLINGVSVTGRLSTSAGNASEPNFNFSADGNTGIFRASEDVIAFSNNGSESMRIDSSGNLLVGTTSDIPGVGNTTLGASLRNNGGGSIAVSRGGDRAGYFNRNTNDGDIIQFRKDGSAVGSIGIVNTNNLFIQGDSTNSGLQCGTNTILPVQNGANASNTIDMGDASNLWKDLYLGGGLYVGGTGTANKLSDYEEGNWTPTFNFSELTGFSGSITTTDATYTKIGNFVSLNVGFSFLGSSGTVSAGDLCTVSGGLPFAQKGSTYGGTGGNYAFNTGSTADISIQPRSGGFRAFITSVVGSPTRASGSMRITYNYQTT